VKRYRLGLGLLFTLPLCHSARAQSMYALRDLTRAQSPFYEMVGPSSEGLRPVAKYVQNLDLPRVKDLKWGFINPKGRVITEPPGAPNVKGVLGYDAVGPFSRGYAPVMWRVYENPSGSGPYLPQRKFHEEKGYIDTNGKFFRSHPIVGKEVHSRIEGKVTQLTGTWICENSHDPQGMTLLITEQDSAHWVLKRPVQDKESPEVVVSRTGPATFAGSTRDHDTPGNFYVGTDVHLTVSIDGKLHLDSSANGKYKGDRRATEHLLFRRK
jgi:hypothetical protein